MVQVLVMVAFVLELSEVEGLLVEKQLERVVVVMDLRRVELVVGLLEQRRGQL